ncbi:MAG: SMI1/KNR4 family protein [Flavobacteriales bacterium]|nr:SMI1/KNR4 family protein [Flavobacteriales bacterium]
MNIKELVNAITQRHSSGGIEVNPPAEISDIAEFEKNTNFVLPADFREFYLTCNGFECTEDLFNMIPINTTRQPSRDFGNNWFYFAEYMINSDMWGLRHTTNGNYEIFNGSFPEIAMTSSLSEFLQRFLKGNIFEAGGLYDWQNELGIKE